jgi:hypothetical protein
MTDPNRAAERSRSSESARRRWRKQKLQEAYTRGGPLSPREIELLVQESAELVEETRALVALPLPGEKP